MNKLALIVAAAATVADVSAPPAPIAQAQAATSPRPTPTRTASSTSTKRMGVYPTLTQDQFDQADANKDGKLDAAEFGTLSSAGRRRR